MWNEHYSLGLFVLFIVTLIHLSISIISTYVAFTFLSCLIMPYLVTESFV